MSQSPYAVARPVESILATIKCLLPFLLWRAARFGTGNPCFPTNTVRPGKKTQTPFKNWCFDAVPRSITTHVITTGCRYGRIQGANDS